MTNIKISEQVLKTLQEVEDEWNKAIELVFDTPNPDGLARWARGSIREGLEAGAMQQIGKRIPEEIQQQFDETGSLEAEEIGRKIFTAYKTGELVVC